MSPRISTPSFAFFSFLLLSFFVVACSSDARAPVSSADSGAARTPEVAPSGEIAGQIAGTLRGRALAPDGKIPLSGAIVALWPERPAARESGLTCDACVPIPKNVPFAVSGPDGSFELSFSQAGSFFLSVEKGAFRRIRPIDVVSGEQDAPAALTTLPGKLDAEAGDEIPKMAVVKGAYDPIERSLTKLGLGKLVNGEVDPDSLPFDFYDDPSESGPRSGARLLADPALLEKYRVVFLPCHSESGTTCTDDRSTRPAIQSSLRDFVDRGGRLYVTDYLYEFVRQLWPQTVTWRGESAAVGSACENTMYDAPAVVDDPGLSDWLNAIGHSTVTLQKSWTTIDGVHEVDGIDLAGNPTKIAPRIWMSAKKSDGTHPATISFDRGCGRVLYSTYHTAGEGKAPLLPQEKALLYVLFEVSACIATDVPK